MRNRNAGEKPEGVEGGNAERKVVMGKCLIVSEVRSVKSEMLSPNREVRNPSDFRLFSSDLNSVHYSDEISNRQFIVDFAKVVDFIEEMKALHPPLRQTALSDRHFGLF